MLNGFRFDREVLELLPIVGLVVCSRLPILLDDDLPSFLMEPKNELRLVVPEVEDILVDMDWWWLE